MYHSTSRLYDRDSDATIRLVPTGWEETDLTAVAQVRATLAFDQMKPAKRVRLPLADTPTKIQHGTAKAQARPTDTGWHIRIQGGNGDHYLIDRWNDYRRFQAQWDDKPQDGQAPSERALLRHLDVPNAWNQHYFVRGDNDDFPLLIQRFDPATDRLERTLMFERAN